MRFDRAFAAVVILGLAGLAACGGGGSTPAPPATGQTTSVPPIAVPGAVVARGQLTLRYPTDFHIASPKSAGRSPAFVDPTSGAILDVYVGGGSSSVAPILATNLDGSTLTDSATVSASPDGTQSLFGIPLFSNSSDIVVIEWNSAAHTQIYALGETNFVSAVPGTSANLAITMQMNQQGFAITQNANGSNATNFSSPSRLMSSCTTTPQAIYVYPTDYQGGYTSPASPAPLSGSGGLPTVTLNGTGGASHLVQNVLGGNSFVFDAAKTPFVLTASSVNPAYLTLVNGGTPGITGLSNLYASSAGAQGVNFSSAYTYSVARSITLQPPC